MAILVQESENENLNKGKERKGKERKGKERKGKERKGKERGRASKNPIKKQKTKTFNSNILPTSIDKSLTLFFESSNKS